MVEESCAPYQGTTKGQKCKNFSNCKPVAKVTGSYFIQNDNQQVKVDDKLIQKEILRNGPVVGEFKAPNHFRYYNGGVLVDEDRPSIISSSAVQVDDTSMV